MKVRVWGEWESQLQRDWDGICDEDMNHEMKREGEIRISCQLIIL